MSNISIYLNCQDSRHILMLRAIAAFYKSRGIDSKSSVSKLVTEVLKELVAQEIKNIKDKYNFDVKKEYYNFIYTHPKISDYFTMKKTPEAERVINKAIDEFFK